MQTEMSAGSRMTTRAGLGGGRKPNIWRGIAFFFGVYLAILALNGAINLFLIEPLEGVGDAINELRLHAEDAGFALLFGFVAIVFLAIYRVFPKEKGYIYLSAFALLAAIQLLSEWDQKTYIVGNSFTVPHQSLAIKCGLVLVAFLLVSAVLEFERKAWIRWMISVNAVLFTVVSVLSFVKLNDSAFIILNRLFLVVALGNIAVHIGYFAKQGLQVGRAKERRALAFGFLLFIMLLLPDLLKDVLEDRLGRGLGYRPIYWEQCLEDTFPWAFLVLIVLFGGLFLRRFAATIRDNRDEIRTRQEMDQLLTALTRAYRRTDMEQAVVRVGANYFAPHAFGLVKLEKDVPLVIVNRDETRTLPPLPDDWTNGSSRPFATHERVVMQEAGRRIDAQWYLAVFEPLAPLMLKERERFALALMARYVSIFAEYFDLMERRIQEMEGQRHEQPWASKLFMQLAEKERTKLASDLHDDVLQEILNLRRQIEHVPGLDSLRLGLENAEFRIRETCRELMPPFLAETGVLQAIGSLLEKITLRADFRLDWTLHPFVAEPDEEKALALYRIVQELMTNAIKHSEAATVRLEIGEESTGLFIRYEDDGRGVPMQGELPVSDRLGMKGMAERIRMFKGSMKVESAPGQGLKIQFSIPMAD